MRQAIIMDDPDLLEVLITAAVISKAQADLVASDHEMTGMPVEDILIARGWLDQSSLEKHAPWLFKRKTDHSPQADNRSYQENLKRYRIIMAEILGESSE